MSTAGSYDGSLTLGSYGVCLIDAKGGDGGGIFHFIFLKPKKKFTFWFFLEKKLKMVDVEELVAMEVLFQFNFIVFKYNINFLKKETVVMVGMALKVFKKINTF